MCVSHRDIKVMEKDKKPTKPLVLSGLVMSWGFFSIVLGSKLFLQMILLSAFGFLVTNRRYIWLDIIFKTLHRDIAALRRFIIINFRIWLWEKKGMTVPKVFSQLCRRHPSKIAFYYENEAWTFQQVEDYSNQVANYFKGVGFKRGDSIALFMENSVVFVGIWLGLSKIGVITGLINSNLRGNPLVHSIQAANSKALIFSKDLKQGVLEILADLNGMTLYESEKTDEDDPNTIDLKKCLSESSKASVKDVEEGRYNDKLLFIYTSGTTGLPKAAVITNSRYFFMAYGVHTMLAIKDDDILYDSLPMYHTSGGIIGVGQCLLTGCSVAIRRKFSASNFWLDCIKYKCTVACYIGEICRYLLSVPEKSHDTQHKIRLMFGNGLRPQIWKRFVERFKIKQIGEFYGATEGISNLINIDSRVGAVGFLPRIAHSLYPVSLIKVNQETEEPIRNAKGYCISCQPGEPGMFVGKINPKKALHSFTGYADKQASEKKILKNVFAAGDQYFNSGDILVMDEYGYFYFKDRTGDTFRWRGENVATAEVEAVISNILGLRDAIVYGVEVPHVEGRAGMAAILDKDHTLDLKHLGIEMRKKLPSYAVPIFIRIITDVPVTGTYKLKKKDLQSEGFNPNKVNDRLYFHDPRTKQFEMITQDMYNDIQNGSVNL
ncbi:UNVERIFIED_CONTAM: hypothetical protein PYX00_004716 [Menopon gallinae]|uniref:long-chain-fatty-acid--CoA ligase n=1 Tax=Menopon gallinae TaxID=328185 RepID=A0AAW2I6W8_9NEOP